ncbi:hypothetical protein CHUAL_005132 [Chamberlinius hualienensis]
MSYSIVIFALAIASFHCVAAQSYKSCQDLPQLYIPFFEPIIDNSPYNYDLGTDLLRCSAEVFTNPPRNDKSFDLYALLIKGTSVAVYKSIINNDRTTINATICDSEFGCASNNKVAFQSQQQKLVDQIKNVPGADLIKDSDDSCYGNNYCPVFT